MKLITIIKEGENIEKALKKYKNKINKLNLIKNIRNKSYYIKPSIKRRQIKIRKKFIINKIIFNNDNK
ncbi:MAG: 30S ribosomal protein S21 [Candidatus Shikimatogenerans bostrichidophilus]|nr:MAG: 30S ribosomal protein S21 [Candidatus Shikimatogenerans bostrichidophilus]